MNSTRGPALKRQNRFHPYRREQDYTNNSTRTIRPDEIAFFTSTGTSGQFINEADMNHLALSAFCDNACFDSWTSYGQWDQTSAGYCTMPVALHSRSLLFDGNDCEPYSVDGLPPLAINQQPVGLQLPIVFGYNDHIANVSPTPDTEKATSALEPLPVEDIVGASNFLDELTSHDDLEEAAQPDFIKTPLKMQGLVHQKQALTFMLQREPGRTSSDEGPGVWKTTNTKDGPAFLNRVTNVGQPQQPTPCYGGIIADPMGFGKTISMLSLLARDVEDGYGEQGIDEEGLKKIQTTLIVVPLSLIHNWKKELSKHVKKGRLAHHIHLQGDPLPPIEQLKNFNVILTTYDQIRTEWKPTKRARSLMFSVSWRRIILDEAHRIRNRESREHKAICKLKSTSRWAVTGTPIQNHLDDLASLFSFIRAYPYNDQICFEKDISRRWRSGNSSEALVRLKGLIRCLVLRRDVEMLALPTREDIQLEVDFTADERDLYDEKVRALGNIVNSDRKGKLQEIGELRQMCNLGLYYKTGQGEVHALIEHIRALSSGEKCLVFSSWRKTLDSIEIGLEHSSIPSVRFDGTVPQEKRQMIVDEFKSRGDVRVMLLTLACGAEGLNVTEATRVYLVEPNWNPSLEEQALSRVWRIGQQHPVTTVRLLMRDSIEAEVVEKQELKRKLTQLLFPSHDDGNAAEDEESLKKLIPII